MLHKCEGYVIRTVPYGETNKIVTLYTRELGKVGVMARGAKKTNSRLSSITQPFTHGSFLFQRGQGIGTLQQGERLSSTRSIQQDIMKTAYASYLSELLDKSVEESKQDPFLFEFFHQLMSRLEDGNDPEILTAIFEIKLLPLLGYYPTLNQCANCGETEGHFHFSIRENGLLCHRCFEVDPYRFQVTPHTIRLIRVFYAFDLSRLGNISVKEQTKKEIRQVIDSYYEEYTGIFIKSKRFLRQMTSDMWNLSSSNEKET
ncbi:DNA repair protein RecO [Mangrovibacillus cuniculi]|uniref:DNA repair protein RecO n=1 Tax=Mangrovibacillus cuniculi TaxID=2593652 RepID=A0A7S8CBK2_9BACI|nr:DNA repair protein RecO [Mangrovibacillus cuniculi]QPC46917.1 DNA repair protein RecO [Mangrovibacillus cuniculi]